MSEETMGAADNALVAFVRRLDAAEADAERLAAALEWALEYAEFARPDPLRNPKLQGGDHEQFLAAREALRQHKGRDAD